MPQALEIPCPINRVTHVLCTRWTLLILRDVIFDNRRTFSDLRKHSPEGIASNMLSARLKLMVEDGLLTQAEEADELQRKPYALTPYAIELLPLMAELARLGLSSAPTPQDARWRLFYGGGPKLWARWQAQLRLEHLEGAKVPQAEDVRYRLQIATTANITGAGPLFLPQADDYPIALPHPSSIAAE